MNFLKKERPQTLVNIDTIFPYIQEPAIIVNREGKSTLGNEGALNLFNITPQDLPKLNVLNLIPTLRNLDEWRMLLTAPGVSSKSVAVNIVGEPMNATLIPSGKDMTLSGILIFHANLTSKKELSQEAMKIAENIGKNILSQKKHGIQESLKEIGEFLSAERLSVLQLNRIQNHDNVVFDTQFQWDVIQKEFIPIIDKVIFNLSDPLVRNGLQKLQSGKMIELPERMDELQPITPKAKTYLFPIMLDEIFQGALLLEKSGDSDPLSESDLFPIKLLSCAMGLWIDRVQEVSQQSKLIQEKETILAELHHRSKNNLAILAGFLDLFEDSHKVMTTKELSRNIRERIQALALIYEVLSSSSELSKLSIQQYLELLVFRIESSLSDNRRISKTIRAGTLYFREVDQMITVGLLINEICLNAYHHGLKEVINPQFAIEVRLNEDTLVCRISDNGPGLPENWNTETLPNTLGFTIIKGLCNQLKSSYQIESNPGCTFILEIKGLDIGE